MLLPSDFTPSKVLFTVSHPWASKFAAERRIKDSGLSTEEAVKPRSQSDRRMAGLAYVCILREQFEKNQLKIENLISEAYAVMKELDLHSLDPFDGLYCILSEVETFEPLSSFEREAGSAAAELRQFLLAGVVEGGREVSLKFDGAKEIPSSEKVAR